MGFNPQSPTKYRGTDQYLVPFVTRDYTPELADYRQPETGRNYPIGCVWQVGKQPIDGLEGDLYMLSKIVANQGYWVLLANPASGPISNFSTDLTDPDILSANIPAPSGVLVEPLAGVVRIAGDNGIKAVSSVNAPGAVTLRFVRGTVETIGAVAVNCITQTIPTNTTLTMQIVVAGFSTAGDGIGAYGSAVVKNVAGVCSLVGTRDLIVNKDIGLNAANITVTVVGTNFLVNVLGVAGKTIGWTTCLPGIAVSSEA